MSHITKASTKVSFTNEEALKKALEMLSVQITVGEKYGHKTYSVPIAKGRMLEFSYDGKEFSGFADRWLVESEHDALVSKIERNYVAAVTSKWLSANRYSSTIRVENGRVVVAGRRF